MPCGLGQVIFSWYNSGVERTSGAEIVFVAGTKAKATPTPVMTGVFWDVFIKMSCRLTYSGTVKCESHGIPTMGNGRNHT